MSPTTEGLLWFVLAACATVCAVQLDILWIPGGGWAGPLVWLLGFLSALFASKALQVADLRNWANDLWEEPADE